MYVGIRICGCLSLLQVKEVVEGKPKPLKQPNLLTQAHFRRQVDSAAALKLVTLTPLFPCLNDT